MSSSTQTTWKTKGTVSPVRWPGNQINDINQFREDCYRQCHLENPTDSGWYEKTNECGQKCKRALQVYEYEQGKNPCELKLQAPVFWFKESYRPFSSSSSTSTSSVSNVDRVYIILFVMMILLTTVYLVVFLVN